MQDVDYYVEDGAFVLTARYLRDRGRCCESGCRHCPYKEPKTNKERKHDKDKMA